MAKQEPGPNSEPKPKADEPPRTVVDATPAITDPPDFYDGEGKKGLHKKHYDSRHKTTIVGTNLKKGDHVVVVGTEGTCVTIWYGTLSLKDGEYVCTNLDVIRQQKGNPKDVKVSVGTEDVSTTVTNPTNGTSAPITTPKVPIIP